MRGARARSRVCMWRLRAEAAGRTGPAGGRGVWPVRRVLLRPRFVNLQLDSNEARRARDMDVEWLPKAEVGKTIAIDVEWSPKQNQQQKIDPAAFAALAKAYQMLHAQEAAAQQKQLDTELAQMRKLAAEYGPTVGKVLMQEGGLDLEEVEARVKYELDHRQGSKPFPGLDRKGVEHTTKIRAVEEYPTVRSQLVQKLNVLYAPVFQQVWDSLGT